MRKKTLLFLAAAAVSMTVAGCSQKETASAAKTPLATMAAVEEEPTAAAPTKTPVEVLSLEDVIDFCYSNPDTDMVFKWDDGMWKDGMDSSILLWQDRFQRMADEFLHLSAVSRVEEPGDLSGYGFENRPYSLYITDARKGSVDIIIGNQDESGNYYALVNDEDVYVIKRSTVEALVFDYEIFAVRDTLDIPVTADQIRKATVSKEKKTTSYKPSNKSAMERIAAGLAAFEPRQFYSYHATDSDLAYCGLDAESRTTLTVEYDNGKGPMAAVIYIGGNSDLEGLYYYVQLDGSRMICDVATSVINDLLNVEEEK